MEGNILSCYPVILPSQVISLSDFTSVRAFHVQGNILLVSGFPVILPTQVILPFDDVIAVSLVAVVRIWYNKIIAALVQG